MPTADRLKFIPSAINNFCKQSYPEKELIIVDDGLIKVKSVIPSRNDIHYIELDKKYTVGAKRNIACKNAHGTIIIHMDDDDWYAQNWIDIQVETLLKSPADICGLDQLFFYEILTGNCWKYTYPTNARKWVAGATMAYYKSFWNKRPFRNIQVGEDNLFVWRRGVRVYPHAHLDAFISILHSGNTSPKYTDNYLWGMCEFNQTMLIRQAIYDDVHQQKPI